MAKLDIQVGEKYHWLCVLGEGERLILPSGQTNRTIKCKCVCGNEKDIRLVHLKRGLIRSCGCLVKTKYGQSSNSLYKVLRSMRDRCDGKVLGSMRYFEKGIKVCDEWIDDFRLFINWAESNGYKKGLQIDRIDNSKGYYPENCRWVSSKENGNNKDNTLFVNYKSEKIALKLLLARFGLDYHYYAIRTRIKRGWAVEKAIETPIRKGDYGKSKKVVNS